MPETGERIFCSACQHESIAKTKRVMDGWTVVRECLVCALCGAELPVEETAPPAESTVAVTRLSALAAFLGEEQSSSAAGLSPEGEHFCKDCVHFLRHPFVSRCLYHNRPTEPMDDCPDFSPRPPEAESGENDA